MGAPCLAVAACGGTSGGGDTLGGPPHASSPATPVRTARAAWQPPGALPVGTVPPVVANGPRTGMRVAITFDSNMTDFMLHELETGKVKSFYNAAVVDELDREQVPATFFLAGKWMERYPDAARRLAADPLFELGSHSYAHQAFHLPCYGLAGLPPGAMADDVRHSFEVLSRFTDHPTRYFRFPGDCYDAAALRALAPLGLTVIHYDVASGDAFGTNVDAIVRHTVTSVRPGSIVVMHITGGNTAPLTADALPRVIAGLRAKGYQLVRVSTLLGAA
ncbi:MAG: polysaccharide deacetylase family protein [Mycobacteriales bacterium]